MSASVDVVHGIDRRTQEHLCGVGPGFGTDAREPAMPITCPLCQLVLQAGHVEWWFGCWRCGCSDIRHDPAEIPAVCPGHGVELIAKPEQLDSPPVSGLGHECEGDPS